MAAALVIPILQTFLYLVKVGQLTLAVLTVPVVVRQTQMVLRLPVVREQRAAPPLGRAMTGALTRVLAALVALAAVAVVEAA